MNKDFDKQAKPQSRISRREFLTFFGMGLGGLMIPRKFPNNISRLYEPNESPEQSALLGRVTLDRHPLFAEPSETSRLILEMPKDSLRRITGVTVSEDETSNNRIWYALDRLGYAHSRRIQPVERKTNPVDTFIPEDGCLGEITMPYVEAYASLNKPRSSMYRFYFSSTFWVLKRLLDDDDCVWYQLLDDRNYRVYYVPAHYIRLVPDSELTALSPAVSPEDKKIVVDLPTQTLTAYEGKKAVYMSRISSGIRLKEGGFATPKGIYRTIRKRPCRHMQNPANDYGSGFDLPGVPWVSYFTSDGVAFHGAYWHNDFGVPHSHGCINMAPQAAKWIYRWTMPTVPADRYFFADRNGTLVIVQ